MTEPSAPAGGQAPQDLGFGAVVADAARRRFLNRDGTFNTRRTGLSLAESRSLYRAVLEMSWPRFIGLVATWYLATNALFASVYLAFGPGALEGPAEYGAGLAGHFLEAFFFSVQTLATIGYGRIAPVGVPANTVVAVESVVGLVTFALITGIAFARFSRPRPGIRYSDHAVVAPYRGGTGFMLRVVNVRDTELTDVRARVALARRGPGGTGRLFDELALERHEVQFFPLTWTLVHPIVPGSPLYGVTEDGLREARGEFLVLLTAFDETTGATVQSRSSYRWDEVRWGERFTDILDRSAPDGVIRVDVTRLSETVPASAPAPSSDAPTPSPSAPTAPPA